MGPSETEQKTPVLPPYVNVKRHCPPTNIKTTPSSPYSSSPSSPDSPLDNPFRDDKSSSSAASSPEHKSVAPSIVPDASPLVPDASKKEPPMTQVMERPNMSSYRIPSSVFKTSKSKAGMEWSMASNDSLFSIHTGNMSFTNDYYSRRMGEVGDASFSSGGGAKVDETTSHEIEVAEGTMNEMIRVISEDRSFSHRSDRSNISTQSFAFPVLAGDVHNGASMQMGSPVIGRHLKQSKPEAKEEQQTSTCTEPQTSTCNEPQTSTYTEPKPTSATENVGWCSCFPSRSFF